MPTYDYICETNGIRLEVMHKMDQYPDSWGELCRLAGIHPGDTPLDAPVKRVIAAAALATRTALSSPDPACATDGCCPGGRCGL